MNKEELAKYYEEIASDVELAKSMTDISSPVDVIELVNRLIAHLDFINEQTALKEYEAAKLKSKGKTLIEYIRTGKEHHKSISITNNLDRKVNNY